ncbi:MAG: zinc-ribbon domain-containing protein [Coriobacteriales bacterium]|jgi:hypothetical protein|nr:zinc-ribbon domain-containing protein [Coriobacteriales bacterium]
MYCSQCGKEAPNSSTFCPYCGHTLEALANVEKPEVPADATGLLSSEQSLPAGQSLHAEQAQTIVTAQTLPAEPPAEPLMAQQQQQPYSQPQQEYIAQPGAMTQPVAQQQPGAMPQPVVQQQPSNVNFAMPQPVIQQQPAAKKRRLVPIIVAAVVVLALIGGGTALAFNFIGSLNKTPLETIGNSIEKLSFDTNSGRIDYNVSLNIGSSLSSGTSSKATGTYSWQYGDDLSSSTFWFTMDFNNQQIDAILTNDTLYGSNGSNGQVDAYSGFIEWTNKYIYQTYGITTDINNCVKSGKLNRDYLDEVGKQIYDANRSTSTNGMKAFGMDLGSIDTNGLNEILQRFYTKECTKQEVWEKFLLNLVISEGKSYSFSFSFEGFMMALADYNYTLRSDDKLGNASKDLTTALRSLNTYISFIPDISFKYDIKDSLFSSLEISANTSYLGTSIDLKFSMNAKDINKTDLASDSRLKDIISSAKVNPSSLLDNKPLDTFI